MCYKITVTFITFLLKIAKDLKEKNCIIMKNNIFKVVNRNLRNLNGLTHNEKIVFNNNRF